MTLTQPTDPAPVPARAPAAATPLAPQHPPATPGAQRLRLQEDLLRAPGTQANWNESRYLDFVDPGQAIAGWVRLGNRPNEGHAERTVCLHLPGGRVAFGFARPSIQGNADEAGGLGWSVEQPFVASSVRFTGELSLLADARALVDPGPVLKAAPRIACELDLQAQGDGLASVLGQESWQVGRIFLPGQADGHYQHLVRVQGTLRAGDQRLDIAGLGCRDHSWGPRNWHAKRHFRWLTGQGAGGLGFMLTVSASDTERRSAGALLVGGRFTWTDEVALACDFEGEAHLLRRASIVARADGREWRIEGEPIGHVPLRHRRAQPAGADEVLRIVKSPMRWRVQGAGEAWGMAEFHDRLHDGLPVERAL